MAVKKAIYQVDNGSGFDEIHFKTTAEQVICKDGKTVEVSLGERVNKSDFTSSKLANGWKRTTDGFLEQWGEVYIDVHQNNVGAVVVNLPISLTGKTIVFQNISVVHRKEGAGGITDSDIERIIANGFINSTQTTIRIKLCDINNKVVDWGTFKAKYLIKSC